VRALAIALIACGSSSEPPPPPPASGLRAIGTYPGTTLVGNGRRVALITADGWHDLAAGGPQAVPAIATRLAKLRGELGELELWLGTHPIAVGGEEHHEHHVRLEPEPRTIELEGHVVRVVALPDVEIWQFEEKLRAQLAVVDARGAVTVLPAHANVAPPIDSPSPVSAKRCAAPAIADLAVAGDAIQALLVECNPAARVRVASYRWPGPRVELATHRAFAAQQLAGTGIAGIANGKLAFVTGDALTATEIPASLVLEAAVAADGAVWTLTTTERDERTVSRAGIAQPIARPTQLALDDDRGITVLAADGTLYTER
jgi:hypothetical protein